MLGFAEQIEFLDTLPDRAFDRPGGRADADAMMLEAARATCDHYIDIAAADGVPYWDAGAPGLASLDGWRDRPADPFNDHEPVDSSAAAIAAQGLLRLGRVLSTRGDTADGGRYQQAGLRVLDTLFDEPYLSIDPDHQGLLLHSVYHWPNGWDYVPPGRADPARRIEPVGRLPRARGGAVREAPRRGRAVPDLLRTGCELRIRNYEFGIGASKLLNSGFLIHESVGGNDD